MGDFLLDLGANPRARTVVKRLGLPLPLPQPLVRTPGPIQARPLADAAAWVDGVPSGAVQAMLASTVPAAGAEVTLFAGETAAWRAGCEAWGRTLTQTKDPPEGARPRVLLFDASGVETPGDLDAAYRFFHATIRRVARSGRLIVVGRPPGDADTGAGAATRAALLGFVKSLAREVGGKGATANLLVVAAGAEAAAAGALRFLVSPRSAFVTGQALTVSVSGDGPTSWVGALDGKVALVTGAARGIGAATARRLAEEGARVVCLDRPEDDAALATVAQAVGGRPFACDVTDPEAPARLKELLETAYGGVDIVVHNAGITRDRTIAKMKPERWDLVFEVNLNAVLRIQQALDDGVMREGGSVVLLSSIAGIAGNMGQTNYAASKAALIGWLRHARGAYAERGIRVNAIAPGFIETRLTAAIPVATREGARRLSALGQGGDPVDVAEAITFMAGPGAVGVTGTVLRVCGGHFTGA